MESENRQTAGGAIIRPARVGDLDELVEQTWAVAAEGRWTGLEVPFHRVARRGLLDGLSSGFCPPCWSWTPPRWKVGTRRLHFD